MKKLLSLAALAITIHHPLASAQSWQPCARLPEAMVPSAVAVNGKIYALRSSDLYRGTVTQPSTMYEYDPATNTWTARGRMSTVRLLHAMVELNGKIYVVGGITSGAYANILSLADVEAFDPATGTWQTRSSLPEPLYVMGAVAADGKLYVVGGVSWKLVNGVRTSRTSNRLFQYDPVAESWTEKAPMNRPRSWFDAVALNGKIYAVGGNNGNTSQPENTIEEYDIASDTWTERGAFTNGIDGQCQAVAIKGKVYTLSADSAATIGELDPLTSRWTALNRLSSPIMDFSKTVVSGRLYMIGGHPVTAMGYSNRVIKYDPVTNTQEDMPAIGQWMHSTVQVGGVIYAIGGVDAGANYIDQVVKLDQRVPPPPTITRQPASQTVPPGTNAVLSVSASGTGALSYRWLRNGQPVAGATGDSLALNASIPAVAGDYTVVVSDANGSTTSWLARIVVATPDPGRLVNLSVRTISRGKNAPVILGFLLSGGSKPLLIRGIGPALAGFGVPGTLPDPVLEVHATVNARDTITANNDQWGMGDVPALRSTFTACGAFGLADATSNDAALVHTVEGLRSVLVYDRADRSGTTLVELYDIGTGNTARLANVSARNFVGTGDNILIAGFSVSGNAPCRLLIRGIGPQLLSYGVTGALADPKLELFMATPERSVQLAGNDNWGDVDMTAARAAFAATGAFNLADTTSKDAALLLTVPAGVFTAQVSGVDGATGEALVEIYEVP
jgi:N-acetylneuraminic acid mutarotase